MDPGTNNFLPFADAGGANVTSQADYQVLAERSTGFQPGLARSAQANKAWRQASVIISQLAQAAANRTGQDLLDDGNVAPVLAALIEMMESTGDANGQVYLQYVSTVAIKLVPENGCRTKINGISRPIPAPGITVANTNVMVSGATGQNLAASTVYNVFAVDDGAGGVTLDFWPAAGGHIPSTTAGNVGVEVRSNGGVPDDTRSYVGKVATSGASQFLAQGIGVASWFNPKVIAIIGTSSTGGNASVTPEEMNPTSRQPFICHAKHATRITLNGYMGNTAPGGPSSAAIGLDVFTVAWLVSTSQQVGSGGPSNAAISAAAIIAEGTHIASPLTWVGAVGGATEQSAALLVEVMA